MAKAIGLLNAKAEASIDATGLESHHVSRYFLHRRGRTKQYRPWTKLTIVCDNDTHLIGAARVRTGPCNDAPDFGPAVTQAVDHFAIDRLLGDGAYDAEPHHRLCREELGIRSTVIPVNTRGCKGCASGRYRRQMQNRFPRRIYRQRWQAESVFSRFKRLFGAALTARTPGGRTRECLYRVLAHDLSILRRAS